MKGRFRYLIPLILLFPVCILNAQENKKSHSIFRDSLDNAYDMSDWLVNKKGVLLVPTIITEPAVGYGAAAVLKHD